MKAVHLLDNKPHKCVTKRMFGKISSIIFFRAEQAWMNRMCNIRPSIPLWREAVALAHLALFTLREGP